MSTACSHLALLGLRTFYASLLLAICTSNSGGKKLFLTNHGRLHRLAGFAQLSWLVYGTMCVVQPSRDVTRWSMQCLIYDIILGLLGITATLSAARDFPHRRVVNRPGESGTLSKSAIVTQSEMIEHSFYQGLNLWQALYLHCITWVGFLPNYGRFAALWLVTCPWMFRKKFPVNSFSSNWTREESKEDKLREEGGCIRTGDIQNSNRTSLNKMYQIKKWQYVFYKHVILHGLNITAAFTYQQGDSSALPLTFEWRVFWLCLNSSYVMEFFMQSLVKRCVLSQPLMLTLQWVLMGVSSLAAVGAVLLRVRYDAAVISLLLNFLNRGHDVVNTLLAGSILSLM